MRLVFFGTPAFAVPSLDALLVAGHEIAAVVTQRQLLVAIVDLYKALGGGWMVDGDAQKKQAQEKQAQAAGQGQ